MINMCIKCGKTKDSLLRFELVAADWNSDLLEEVKFARIILNFTFETVDF
jgi:hypothetical protein